MFNPVHEKKKIGKNAPDKQRRNKTMASAEVAAIFCSGAKALSCCVNGSHQKMCHSETRFRRYVSGREAPCLAGGCALRHFCQSYSKRDGTSNLLGIFGWSSITTRGQHLHHHEMEAARPIKTGIPSCAARSVTKKNGQTFAPPHVLGKCM